MPATFAHFLPWTGIREALLWIGIRLGVYAAVAVGAGLMFLAGTAVYVKTVPVPAPQELVRPPPVLQPAPAAVAPPATPVAQSTTPPPQAPAAVGPKGGPSPQDLTAF